MRIGYCSEVELQARSVVSSIIMKPRRLRLQGVEKFGDQADSPEASLVSAYHLTAGAAGFLQQASKPTESFIPIKPQE